MKLEAVYTYNWRLMINIKKFRLKCTKNFYVCTNLIRKNCFLLVYLPRIGEKLYSKIASK